MGLLRIDGKCVRTHSAVVAPKFNNNLISIIRVQERLWPGLSQGKPVARNLSYFCTSKAGMDEEGW